MNRYEVIITEFRAYEARVMVEAESEDEAYDKAEQNYNEGQYIDEMDVVEPDERGIPNVNIAVELDEEDI